MASQAVMLEVFAAVFTGYVLIEFNKVPQMMVTVLVKESHLELGSWIILTHYQDIEWSLLSSLEKAIWDKK